MNINLSLMMPAASCTSPLPGMWLAVQINSGATPAACVFVCLSGEAFPSTRRCIADVHLQVARCLPWVVNNYKLEEITTVQELRRNCAKLFKLNANLRNPGVSTMSRHAHVSCALSRSTALCGVDWITNWAAACRPWTCWCTRAERSSR